MQEKQIKIEQVALSACLTRKDKVMLSCLNSMTSFRKTRELLLDWCLIDPLPAMNPVSLKSPEFLRGKLEGMIGVRVISYLLPDFPLSVVLALKRYGSVMRTSRTKAILIFRPLQR